MQNFMMTLLICSLTMSVLALLYLLATPFLSKRYTERWRYYAWFLIVLAFLIPFRPQWHHPLMQLTAPQHTAPIFARMNGSAQMAAYRSNMDLPLTDGAGMTSVVQFSWGQLIALIWLVGAAAFLLYHGIKHHQFKQMLQRWSEPLADARVEVLLEQLKSEMEIKTKISLQLCPSVGSPMLLGLLNPSIYLPTAELSTEALTMMLRHELVHHKQKDLLYKFLLLLATALHWFNPIVYLMGREIHALCEKVCDKEVIRQEGEEKRRFYGTVILGVITEQSKFQTALSTGFYSSKRGVKNRITSLMDKREKKTGILLLSVVLLLSLGGGYFLTITPAARAVERSAEHMAITEAITSFAAEHGIADPPLLSLLPEGFALTEAWTHPTDTAAGIALYLRIGNGTQSFDLEVQPLAEGEGAFAPWMYPAAESELNGRWVKSGEGWLSIQADERLRYTFMWGAHVPETTNLLGDELFTQIAQSFK